MKLKTWILVAAVALSVAPVLCADEYDYVGYKYSDDRKRDFERGFFIGAETWYANAKNLHFEPAVWAPVPLGTAGGRLLDVDFDYEWSAGAFLGYKANRRIGTFTLTYWDFHEGADRSESGGPFYATGTHPSRGSVGRPAFAASADVDVEYAQLDWQHEFGWGRRFVGFWGVGLTGWEIEYATDSVHFDPLLPASAVAVSEFSSTKGFGGKGLIGGRYNFNKYFSMAASMGIGFSATEQDYLYSDSDVQTGATVAILQRQDTELTTIQYEGDASVRVRMGGGFAVDLGYRYLSFDDAIAKDRFVDAVGKYNTVEQSHEIAFEGPYLNVRYITGVAKVDSDGDGVMDVYDDCNDTPSGAWVNEQGCPRDLDEDGVYDGIDRCPGTAFGTRVDEFGCGVDTDGDKIPDGLDLCPNTPLCARVDGKGCPIDTDADGVADGCDACPATSTGHQVDSNGCDLAPVDGDQDGDGVADSRDKCPNTERGAQVDENGCAVVVAVSVHFATDRAEINGTDMALLDRVAQAMAADGGSFEVAGHTDGQSSVEYNQGLSERRAAAVRQYLVDHGCDASKLVAVGYSELKPVASNDDEAGRALNRRVEILRR